MCAHYMHVPLSWEICECARMYAYPRTDLDDLLIFSINARARVYTCAVLRPPWLHHGEWPPDASVAHAVHRAFNQDTVCDEEWAQVRMRRVHRVWVGMFHFFMTVLFLRVSG